MKQLSVEIVANRKIQDSLYEMSFFWPVDAGIPKAGQFFTARSAPGTDPLLRRPFAFSAYNVQKGIASCIYQVRGGATRLLAELATGSFIDVLGPLGIGFTLPGLVLPPKVSHESIDLQSENQTHPASIHTNKQVQDSKPFLIAGGIGLGPMLFLEQNLRENSYEYRFALGVRSKNFLPDIELPKNSIICTDDGSFGLKGSVLSPFEKDAEVEGGLMYACGPHPMLAACNAFAHTHSMDLFVSVEQTMACGLGACMGCAVQKADSNEYFRACVDGPVFNAKELLWK